MYNPIAAEAVARALVADRLAQADAARRARQARRAGRRHDIQVAMAPDPVPACL
ncbi:MAG: hypothetical protein ACLFWM_07720 [Actinomycetota bacterium]